MFTPPFYSDLPLEEEEYNKLRYWVSPASSYYRVPYMLTRHMYSRHKPRETLLAFCDSSPGT
jgi:hypothetical protein